MKLHIVSPYMHSLYTQSPSSHWYDVTDYNAKIMDSLEKII